MAKLAAMNQLINLTFELVGSRLDPPASSFTEVLVDVVTMRDMGVKLPLGVIKTAEPMRGLLQVHKHTLGPCRRPDLPPEEMVARLLQASQVDDIPLAHITEPRLTRVAGHQFVLIGLEHHGHATLGTKLPQAWWCRLVLGPPERATAIEAGSPGSFAGAESQVHQVLTSNNTCTAARESLLAVAPPTCRGVTRLPNCLPVE